MKFIDGYEKTRLGRRFAALSYSGSVSTKNKKTRFSLHKAGEKISSFLAATRSTFYGALFISFGLAVLLFYFLNEYAGEYEGRNIATLVMGAACALVSIPFLLVDKPSHRMVSESRVLDYIFFEFLCMKRAWSPEGKRGAPTVLGVILGVLFAALGILVPVGRVALVLVSLALVYLAFSSPEFPYLLSLLIIPYSPYIPDATLLLAALAALSFVAFFKKTVSGKRVVHIEQYDILLIIMLIFVCIYAFLTRENAKITDALIVVSLFMGYPLASNTITNRRLADTMSNGFVVATLPIAVITGVMNATALIKGEPLPTLPEAVMISAVACAVLSIRLVRHSLGLVKAVYIVFMLIYAAAVALTLSPVYIAALFIGLLTAVLYRVGKYFPIIIAPLCLALSLTHLLPRGIAEKFFKFLSTDGTTLISVLFFSAIGVVIFVIAVLLMLIRLRHRIVYSVFLEGTHLKSIAVGYAGALAGIIMVLSLSSASLSGCTLYLLLSVLGMGSAALRVAKSESDNAELYFEDSKSTDSSTLNVLIH